MSSEKPLIYYIDDEPKNLAVFEMSLPETWEIKTFDDPRKAVDFFKSTKTPPAVIISDQRMPGMTGVEVLELAKDYFPNAVRIVVTGYSDEDLVVESVRKAQIFDYIRKPWDFDDLLKSLTRAVQHHILTVEKQSLFEELKSWVSPLALWAVQNKEFQFPVKKDLIGITFDLKNSSEIHSINQNGVSLRSRILQVFGESVLECGGWTESYSGDSGYAHYGLMGIANPCHAALRTAFTFKNKLLELGKEFNKEISCGIALHPARDSIVDLRVAHVNSPSGKIIQKSFDTSSLDIDHLHRIEKIAHKADGIHILCSDQFKNAYDSEDQSEQSVFTALGDITHKGSQEPTQIHYISTTSSKVPSELFLNLEKLAA